MKVLIVDDQYEKVKTFSSVLYSIGVDDVKHVTNSLDALRACKSDTYDLMVLDLQLPARLGEDVDPRGGVELLDRLELDHKYQVPVYVVAATSYRDTYEEYRKYFQDKGWNILCGEEDEEGIKELFNSLLIHSGKNVQPCDIAILTALPNSEQEAVLRLPCDWEEKSVFGDCNKYYRGTITTSLNEKKSIITTCCPRMGIASSAVTATKIIQKYKPKFIIMVGIAAGIKGKVNIGDILVADPCWDWGSGKMTIENDAPKFLKSPHYINLSTNLRILLREMSVARDYLDEIYSGWNLELGNRPTDPLNLHVGPLATGAVVIEDPSITKLILDSHRETVGVEMEAYGVVAAAEYANDGQWPVPIIIKSVCDFADPDKNDNWQGYAAYTSAAFAYKLVVNHLFG